MARVSAAELLNAHTRIWQQLKSDDLTPKAALALIVQPDGTVNWPLINPDVSRSPQLKSHLSAIAPAPPLQL